MVNTFADGSVNLIREPIKGKLAQLTHYNSKFIKSKEGVAQYKKVGLPYPNSPWDTAYEEFIKSHPDTEANEHRHKNKVRVLKMTRYRLGNGKEYIVYSQEETRYNGVGASRRFTRQGIGKYPVVEFTSAMVQDEYGVKRESAEVTGNTLTGFSIPFSIKEADRIHQNATDSPTFNYTDNENVWDTKPTKATTYSLRDANKNFSIHVQTYEDWRDGDFQTLWEYSKIPKSEDEKQAIADSIEKQKQLLEQQKLETLKRSV